MQERFTRLQEETYGAEYNLGHVLLIALSTDVNNELPASNRPTDVYCFCFGGQVGLKLLHHNRQTISPLPLVYK